MWKARYLVPRKSCTTIAFMQLTLEDKGTLAKLVESIRVNYTNRTRSGTTAEAISQCKLCGLHC